MFEKFYPNEYVNSIYTLDFKELYARGYRGILFDIDNTLVPHGHAPTKAAISLFKELKEIGFKTCLISNNKEKRVKSFADKVGSYYIFNAQKPSIKNYIKSMYIMQTALDNTLFIGDQIFTDVYGANRAQMYTILVKPIHPKEEIQIVLKRRLERIVLHFYKRKLQAMQKK